MVRERFDSSMRSRSTITTLRKPSKAAFFRISFPRAPAPTTNNRQLAILDWSHQGMSRKRLNRSSCVAARFTGSTGRLPYFLAGVGGCHRLEPGLEPEFDYPES